jgi:hypothetical protein
VDAGAAEAKSTLRRHPGGIAQGTSHSEIRIRTDCSVCASLARPEALTSLAKVPGVLGWRASHLGGRRNGDLEPILDTKKARPQDTGPRGWVYAVDADTGVWKWRLKSNYPILKGDNADRRSASCASEIRR